MLSAALMSVEQWVELLKNSGVAAVFLALFICSAGLMITILNKAFKEIQRSHNEDIKLLKATTEVISDNTSERLATQDLIKTLKTDIKRMDEKLIRIQALLETGHD